MHTSIVLYTIDSYKVLECPWAWNLTLVGTPGLLIVLQLLHDDIHPH